MRRALAPLLLVLSLVAAGWAVLLVGKHHQAVANLLEPGGLCGQDGGCEQVLASEYSEIFSVPVSVPAVPLYLGIAILAGLSLAGRLSRERLSAVATAAGLGGAAFGGWLLFHMVSSIGEICPYCLIMDGLNLGVLALGVLLHPSGPVAALKGVFGLPKTMLPPGAEAALLAFVLLGTPLVHRLTGEMGKSAPVPTPVVAAPTPAAPGAKPTAPAAPVQPVQPGTRRLVLPAERATLQIGPDTPTKGKADAPVTIVLFEDFQCPFCKKLDGNVVMLQEEMKDKVRVAFKHFPMNKNCNDTPLQKSLHASACGSAAAAVCAHEQGKFWPMHDLMFRNNTRLKGKDLLEYAAEVGLDEGAFRACLQKPETMAKVKADSKEGGAGGVTGTPALFVNGRKLVGAQPIAVLRAAVQAELDGKNERVIMDIPDAEEIEGPAAGGPSTVQVQGRLGPFQIDAFEASVVGGKAQSKSGAEVARGSSWYEADAACRAAGKRLCSEEEWLTACIGAVPTDEDRDGVFSNDGQPGRQHVYGEHYREGLCAVSRGKDDGRALTTGTHPECRTPDGIYDMEGVTKEWVGLSADRASVKGGSYFSGDAARCAFHKDNEAPDSKDMSLGFRCCQGPVDAAVQAQNDRFPGGKVGEPILVWSAPKRGGGTLGTKELAGKPYIMTFWASWCGPCKKELPALAALYEQYKSQGLEVIGVNVDEKQEAGEAYLQANPLPFPVVWDGGKKVMSRFDTRGVPTTFWVKRDGTIRQRTVGYDEENGKRDMNLGVTALLAK